MEQAVTPNLWALPATIIAIVGICLTIIGWIVTAYLARKNNANNLKKLEINRLIDELFYKLDFIYSEMLELLENKEKDKRVSYFIFTSSVRHVEFICERIQLLDASRTKDTGFIAELRQACTNDTKYEADKVGTTLHELQSVSEKIKSKYLKSF
ncbi:hypothetical protein J9A51_25630 [Klebsiella pneumoniae]|uniref:hypothetical protein n=1 Tax=Enterobacteriaceae TaxID=543 RepID=UPI0003BB3385|nr:MULTISPECIES: hypothetical protein [Enterobacteriaceae]HBQ3195485.1 hypothetical protein [Klebsiella variicola subsp. variicola]AIX00269.1 hypothetical protein LQ47_14370 [Klebsiella pneumoniae]EIX9216721.1 hypothetical protein [Klebsiella pneumoniae]EIX9741169.1 hypothetical protein [Klebsiella pneumoniae]EKX4703113.1 hypothetical protein [Klebsiella pneumoniae]